MKNLKQTGLLIVTFILLIPLTAGCEKEDSSSGSKSIEGMLYYYTNEAGKAIRVIDISAATPFRRSYILSDDVTLEDIAVEREHLVLKAYRPVSVSQIASKKGLILKSKPVLNNWLYVANYPFLGLTGTTNKGWFEASEFSNDATGFKFHKTGVIEGEDEYAIESVAYPGRFFTHSGHPIQGANLLYLDEYPGPEEAPKFRLYRPRASFAEANSDVPVDAYFAW